MSAIRKNDFYTVTVDGFSSGGDGVAHIDGQAVFIKGALSGEKCEIKILKENKTLAYARLERLLEASSHRVEPACPNFGKCGGCDLMHMDYDEELVLKRRRVDDALIRIGGLNIKCAGIVGSDKQEKYRNKAIYAVGKAVGHAVTGFYRERSHDIVPTEKCLIQSEISDRAAGAVRRWMDDFSVPAYDEKLRSGAIRHVFCRYAFATGKAQITVITAEKDLPGIDALTAGILEACPETASIVLDLNKTHGNTVLAGEFHTIWGGDCIEDCLCGLRFKLSPRSFYQINRAQAEKLYAKAVDYAMLTGKETVLDLYCGTGTITLCMAVKAGRVIGAEIVEAAVLDARENASLNGITNAEFLCADVSEAVKTLVDSGLRPEVVVVDPPRKGLAPDVIETIAHLGPERVVYVSCDPATLARDLRLFDGLGYITREATAFDMFPRCAHVETVVLLSRKIPDDQIVVDLDLNELDATSAGTKSPIPKSKRMC